MAEIFISPFQALQHIPFDFTGLPCTVYTGPFRSCFKIQLSGEVPHHSFCYRPDLPGSGRGNAVYGNKKSKKKAA
jgi:hypothetical protein